MRDIQRHDDDRNAGFEHDISGFRVDVNVELCSRGDVADLKVRAAHQHDLLHARDDVRRARKGGGNIGQRPQRAQGYGMRGM